jgi:aminomethyltransferase
VQGPFAREILAPLADADLGGMKYYSGQDATIAGVQSYVSRTGYTGEDGFELVVPNENAVAVWEAVLAAGQSQGAMPAGLAARDTLRLEAGMPLYGHELSESINPIQAGLKFAVNLDREFVGRERIARFAQDPAQPKRVGLELSGRRVPREHYPITQGEELLGEVTSGTFSPTLDKPIAMGYVRPEFAAAGTELEIDIRGRRAPAAVVPLPFYQRQS